MENHIKKLSNNFIEVFPNTWFITSSSLGIDINNILSKYVGKDEQILITETTGDVSCTGINNKTIEFLNSYS
ncbi:hypothetical protein [Chryseobacterium sp. RLHN22]|uniref:hypothetical protein n=1 Tax=Chryseobacterium sp. RLHN22 TaxID=3437885 RepID=UPI003D9BCABE